MRIPLSLGINARQKKIDESQGSPSAEMTFSVTNDYPDKVTESDGQIFRVMGKRNQQSIYALSAMGIGGREMKLASAAKARLIDALVAGGEAPAYSKENISKAMQTARSLLCDSDEKELLAYMVAHDTVGYGPISMLLDDRPNMEEIVVNSPKANIGIYHSKYGFCTTNLRFNSERDFRYMINKLICSTERELNSSAPIIDAQLDDGSRVHAQLRPYSVNGAAASIRLSGGKSMDLRRLMELGTATPELLAYIWLALETNHNILISGAPASGKTSMLLALNAFVPRYQRVITIEEDVNELKFYSNFMNSVSLQGSTIEGRASVKDQVINALHLRPDRLIVGEIRGSEANEMLSGSNFGIPFMTTMHSSGNGQAVVNRLQAKPMGVESQILSMLDISIFMRQEGLMSRKVDSVVEYCWLSRDEIGVDELNGGEQFRMLETGKDGALLPDTLERSKAMRAYSKAHLLSMARCRKELGKRAAFLKSMLESECGTSAPDYIVGYGEIK